MLHVSVRDRSGRYITGLTKDAFTVIDDAKPQTLEMFSADEVPATVGFLIDNSNSMRPNRERVVASAVAFATHSHPEDEIFALTFNEAVQEAWSPDSWPRSTRRSSRRRCRGDRGARHDRDLRRDHVRAVTSRAREAHAPGADRGERRRRQRQPVEARRHAHARARFRRDHLHRGARRPAPQGRQSEAAAPPRRD